MSKIIQTAVVIRNYLVYKKYDFLARVTHKSFPLDPTANFVISIASYPKRIHLVPAVFEALSGQTVKSQKVCLVLSEEEWPEFKLPHFIEKLVMRGVEIVWTRENPYAVKKIIPTYVKYPDLGIVILDDDMIYGSTLIEKLINNEYFESGCIVGHVAKALHKKGNELGMFFRDAEPAGLNTDNNQVFFIGWGGVYYPPKSLDSRVSDLSAIKRIVPGRGCDIWLWAAAVASGTKQISLGTPPNKDLGIPIPLTDKTAPREILDTIEIEKRFQKVVDFFGIREKLLDSFPDRNI